jgi:adenosylcobinamide-phosphate synthase
MSGLLALIVDRLFGEPPAALHPVVWMGHYLAGVGKKLPQCRPAVAFASGMAFWMLGAGVVAALFAGIDQLVARLPAGLALVVLALCLKPLLALRMLLQEVRRVEDALDTGLESGRIALSRIVSRDTRTLEEREVRESALESLSENLSDSVVAPLFWFTVLGLPGAAVYRFANTADAMWGYRGQWEWAGKFAARVDDVLNWVPARLTAAVILVAFAARADSWRRLPHEAARTHSPNSGWPMAALALALHVRLSKPGVYALNPEGRLALAADTTRSLERLELVAWSLGIGFALLAPFKPLVAYG